MAAVALPWRLGTRCPSWVAGFSLCVPWRVLWPLCQPWPDTNQAAPSLRWLAAGLTVASTGR
ncbi:hypothetical protein SEA_LOADRIE_140 [Mycobacterium phage Loadrie]|nr:hypothetical protein SEA_LOADRIE_140 [Mycobacterium phage Loadrie]